MARISRRGFTLIELLTVIAIIALLAAILFPVFGRVQQNRRFATCIANMHDINVAASLYKDDQGGYPHVIFGVAEQPDRMPWIPGGPTPVPMNKITRGTLYPTYIKDVEKFHCPNNPARTQNIVVQAAYPPSSPWSSLLTNAVPTFSAGGIPFSNLPSNYNNQPISFYAYDSYGISSSIDLNGKRVANAGSAPGFFVVYSKDWTAAKAQGQDPRQDRSNQLIYHRSMPADKTVVTWCNHHVTSGGGDKVPVLLASGTVRPLDYKEVLRDGFNVMNR